MTIHLNNMSDDELEREHSEAWEAFALATRALSDVQDALLDAKKRAMAASDEIGRREAKTKMTKGDTLR